jgi:hypothetical protein
MKNWSKILSILGCCVVVLLHSNTAFANKKKTDWRKSFSRTQKAPYGTFLAYETLQTMFGCKINDTKNIFENDNYDQPEIETTNYLKIIIAKRINFSFDELKKLLLYAEQGNYVLLSAEEIDEELLQKFGLQNAYDDDVKNIQKDSNNNYHRFLAKQQFFLENTNLQDSTLFTFTNGEPINSYINEVYDSSQQQYIFPYQIKTIGYNPNQFTNCAVIRYGNGKIILHSSPLLLTNYFLLQGNNKSYLERLASYLPNTITHIDWHQFAYRYSQEQEPDSNNPLKGLMKYPMWKAAIMLAALGLLLFILSNAKRRQRQIPIIAPLQNTSLDFVETIGQLYYNKADHKNLSEKMIVHLLEKIRAKTKLPTNKLDAHFEKSLATKIEVSPQIVTELVQKINTIRNMQDISEEQLVSLYTQIQFINQYI